jgi:hypothetical protein
MALLKRKVTPCLEGPFSLSEASTFVEGCWISSAEEGSLPKWSTQQLISDHHMSCLRMSHMTLSWLEISDGPFVILDSFSSYSCSTDRLLILIVSFYGCCSSRTGFLRTLHRLHVLSSLIWCHMADCRYHARYSWTPYIRCMSQSGLQPRSPCRYLRLKWFPPRWCHSSKVNCYIPRRVSQVCNYRLCPAAEHHRHHSCWLWHSLLLWFRIPGCLEFSRPPKLRAGESASDLPEAKAPPS